MDRNIISYFIRKVFRGGGYLIQCYHEAVADFLYFRFRTVVLPSSAIPIKTDPPSVLAKAETVSIVSLSKDCLNSILPDSFVGIFLIISNDFLAR